APPPATSSPSSKRSSAPARCGRSWKSYDGGAGTRDPGTGNRQGAGSRRRLCAQQARGLHRSGRAPRCRHSGRVRSVPECSACPAVPVPGSRFPIPGLLMLLPAANPIALAPAQATPRADVEKAARELETQFAHMLIKSMRSASPGNALGGDTRYRDMYDQQLARELTKGRGLGLAPMIMRQLQGSQTAPAPAPAALALHRPGDSLPAVPMPLAPGGALPAMLPLAPARSG